MAQSIRLSVDGTRISDVDVQRGLRLNIIAGSLCMVLNGFSVFLGLNMLFERLNVSGLMIGILTAVQQLAMLAQIAGAYMAERTSNRRKIWAVALFASRILWFVPVFIPWMVAWGNEAAALAVLIAVALSSVIGQAGSAPWFSWMADLVPDRMRGSFWSKRLGIITISTVVSIAASGYLLDRLQGQAAEGGQHYWGFCLIFLIGAAAGVADIVIHCFVPEPRAKLAKNRHSMLAMMKDVISRSEFRVFTISMVAWYFSCSLAGGMVQIYMKRNLGMDYSCISWVVISQQLGGIVAGVFSGYLLGRMGNRTFAILMMLVAPVINLAVWVAAKPDVVGLTELFSGIPIADSLCAWAIDNFVFLEGVRLPQATWLMVCLCLVVTAPYFALGLAQLSLCSQCTPKEGRTMAMAIHWTCVGLAGGAGSILCGKMMDVLNSMDISWCFPNGVKLSFIHILSLVHLVISWLVCVPIMSRLRLPQKDMPVATAFWRLLDYNPLRLVTNIYNIYTVGADVDSQQKAKAVRELGERKAAIAVADLIENLDDPSADVREEAAAALGSIGAPEAVDALLAELDDPHSDLGPEIARALRKSKDTRVVEPLIRKLADPDQETRAESARTLGTMGDRRATAPLLKLLQHSSDAKTVSASSEALSRLGEMAAIYEILPRMKATRNPVLKRSLAVAVGDLLGEQDEFYRILGREAKTRGREAGRLLEDLSEAVADATSERYISEGKAFRERIGKVRSAYEDSDHNACAELLFDCGFTLAALAYGVEYGLDAKAAVQDIIWRDQRFGIGLWFLYMLRYEWEGTALGARDDTDILLGIYFLGGQGMQKAKRLAPTHGDIGDIGGAAKFFEKEFE